MPDDRDGKHAGGSIVDSTRANMSPEQIEKDNEARQKEQAAGKDRAAEEQKEDHP